MAFLRSLVAFICVVGAASCRSPEPGAPAGDSRSSSTSSRPSILLVTLDTTRADAAGPEARGVETRGFNALAARGRRFRQAYATAPETLPSHSSMMTGLYPAGHGVHENARYLADTHPVLAARLKDAGYRTAAFVSSFILARRFGLARGFDVYDDTLPAGQVERTSRATTDAAVAYLAQTVRATSSFSGFTTSIRTHPTRPQARPQAPTRAMRYLGEVAAMDGRWPARSGLRGVRLASRHLAGDHRRRRSRRGPRRPWRAPARQPSLSVDDARAAGGGGTGRRGWNERYAGQHAAHLLTPCSTGPASTSAHSLRAVGIGARKSCSAKR